MGPCCLPAFVLVLHAVHCPGWATAKLSLTGGHGAQAVPGSAGALSQEQQSCTQEIWGIRPVGTQVTDSCPGWGTTDFIHGECRDTTRTSVGEELRLCKGSAKLGILYNIALPTQSISGWTFNATGLECVPDPGRLCFGLRLS